MNVAESLSVLYLHARQQPFHRPLLPKRNELRSMRGIRGRLRRVPAGPRDCVPDGRCFFRTLVTGKTPLGNPMSKANSMNRRSLLALGSGLPLTALVVGCGRDSTNRAQDTSSVPAQVSPSPEPLSSEQKMTLTHAFPESLDSSVVSFSVNWWTNPEHKYLIQHGSDGPRRSFRRNHAVQTEIHPTFDPNALYSKCIRCLLGNTVPEAKPGAFPSMMVGVYYTALHMYADIPVTDESLRNPVVADLWEYLGKAVADT
jgi:hypothetical protein